MAYIDLLPAEIRKHSLSLEDIILPYPVVYEALKVLRAHSVSIRKWETYLRSRDGTQSPHPTLQGSFAIEQMQREAWTDFVFRSHLVVRRGILEDLKVWKDEGSIEHQMYFHILPVGEPLAFFWFQNAEDVDALG
jgi:hypothetical protein